MRDTRETLHLTHDRKVSPRGWQQHGGERAGRWVATVANSFGLPAGLSCPGKTPFCESCYAVRSEHSSGVLGAMMHNARLLTEAGSVEAMTALLVEMLSRYAREADRVELPAEDRVFRIHWDGDFFSTDYARAWARVIYACHDIQFWAYTRSFRAPVDVVPILAGIPNLALYLSVDEYNVDDAFAHLAKHEVHLALCGEDYQSARALIPAERRPIICPENAERMPLMDNGRGACVECRLCVDGRRDVIFSTSHRENIHAIPVTIGRRRSSGTPPLYGPPAPGQCALIECSAPLVRKVGRAGRPKKYCGEQCRWAHYHQRSKAA